MELPTGLSPSNSRAAVVDNDDFNDAPLQNGSISPEINDSQNDGKGAEYMDLSNPGGRKVSADGLMGRVAKNQLIVSEEVSALPRKPLITGAGG